MTIQFSLTTEADRLYTLYMYIHSVELLLSRTVVSEHTRGYTHPPEGESDWWRSRPCVLNFTRPIQRTQIWIGLAYTSLKWNGERFEKLFSYIIGNTILFHTATHQLNLN